MPGHRKRRQFKQTDAFTRGMVIGLKRAVIVAVYACGVDVEKGPIRQQLWNAPPCDNVESWFGTQSRMIPDHLTARPTRSALADAAALGAFCRRLTSENAVGFGAESAPSSSSLAAAVVLRGTATPFLNGFTTRSARRALDRPRLAATPISRFTSRWSPTIGPLPSRIDWASLRRCAYSGHEPDAALKLALHALPHPAHPASASHQRSFNIIGRPPDLQAWIFGGSGLEDDALSILASAKLRIYRYFVQEVKLTRREGTYRAPVDVTYAAHRLLRATDREMDGATTTMGPGYLTRHPEETSPTMPDPCTSAQKKTRTSWVALEGVFFF
ncbi:hypothetical protein LAZ67_4003134 [Cordylochernes scorpioides]|uniref:Uncharacterized protein n=1 Tax=Cordylochernes scorpioides TaxID=51811 RepID=A0ABY6KE52_9ARAC|nr:hypothetical protein LAZ67_4003134 [Cordylochernes scorpioides]